MDNLHEMKIKYDLFTPEGRAGFLVEVPREELLGQVYDQVEIALNMLCMLMHIDGEDIETSDSPLGEAVDGLQVALEILEDELGPNL